MWVKGNVFWKEWRLAPGSGAGGVGGASITGLSVKRGQSSSRRHQGVCGPAGPLLLASREPSSASSDAAPAGPGAPCAPLHRAQARGLCDITSC